MSVVVVRNYKNKIVIGSDSISVLRFTQSKIEYGKLHKINKDFIIGGVGLSADNSQMSLFARNHQPQRADEDGVMDFITEFIKWKKVKLDAPNTSLENSRFIIVFKKKVFVVEGGTLLVQEIKEGKYDAIGAGMDYALSSLYLGQTVEKAVEVACELSIYCEKPINLITIKK